MRPHPEICGRAPGLSAVKRTAGVAAGLAAEPESAEKPNFTAVVMTLDQCIEAALANNPDIEMRKLTVISDERFIAIEEAAFDPDFSAGFTLGDSRRPTASVVTGSRRKTTEVSLGYGGKVESGDSYDLSFSQLKTDTNSNYSALNPSYSFDLSFSFTRPLKRGRGENATLSRLKISKLDRKISDIELRDEITGAVYNVEKAYWGLAYAQKALEARRESLELAKATLKRTQGMIEKVRKRKAGAS